MEDVNRINKIVSDKAKQLKTRLQQSIAQQGIEHVDTSLDAEPLSDVVTRVSKEFGVANRIRIRFNRSGVFVHKGVGRGTKASQVGSTNRKPKPWFNPIVEEVVNELASDVADEIADIDLNKLLIK